MSEADVRRFQAIQLEINAIKAELARRARYATAKRPLPLQENDWDYVQAQHARLEALANEGDALLRRR